MEDPRPEDRGTGGCGATMCRGPAGVGLGPAAEGPAAMGPAAVGPSAMGPAAMGPAAMGPAAEGLGPAAAGRDATVCRRPAGVGRRWRPLLLPVALLILVQIHVNTAQNDSKSDDPVLASNITFSLTEVFCSKLFSE